ncbi:MAG: hypothetical protein QM270_02610 [Bacillota bacterium]|nr:hypothetical protein [Bacillota bacterium]
MPATVCMESRRVQLAVCWLALLLIYLLGDVLRLYEKGREVAVIDGRPMSQLQLLLAALFMLVPILMALGMVFLPQGVARWAGLICSAALFIINIFGVAGYTGLFDRVLIALSLLLNLFIGVWTWLW